MLRLIASLSVWLFLALVPSLMRDAAAQSPYAGEEGRAIKALSAEEMQALLNGEGMGLAKVAELNGYPGPRHVLDLAVELDLSDEQRVQTQVIFDRMQTEAQRLGREIVNEERALDSLFVHGGIDAEVARERILNIAWLQGDLRSAHVKAHLDMMNVLTPGQVQAYARLRGYAGVGTPDHGGEHHHEH